MQTSKTIVVEMGIIMMKIIIMKMIKFRMWAGRMEIIVVMIKIKNLSIERLILE
jgi:hypothetical protein